MAGLVGKRRRSLFDEVVGPLMGEYAERYARDRVKYFEEYACPTCKEPMHPKAKACWKCNHDGIRKSYDHHISVTLKLRQYVRSQGMLINLALSALGRSAKQKKKGPFVRQARGILEAALAEPEPGASLNAWSLASIAGIGLIGMMAYGMTGYYARSKAAAWGAAADAGPPPTAEELSKSP
jgi:ribosomal protein L37AE/L43A